MILEFLFYLWVSGGVAAIAAYVVADELGLINWEDRDGR